MECVELLLGVKEVDWNEKDSRGSSPLMKGLMWRRLDIVKVMLQCPRVDVAIDFKEGKTPEMWARSAQVITIEDCNICFQGKQST